jgi:HK97 family phage major capsid protein
LNTLIQAKDNETFFRTIANVLQPTTAKSVGAPSLDADPSDPEWTSEIGTRSEDSTMAFGGRELTPHPLAKLLKLSNKLVRSVPNIGTLVAERLGYKQATTEENAFLNGDGAGVPLGVFKASAAGISTGRDVTASAATSFKFDDIIDLEHKVAEQYRESCIFLVHDDFIKRARKLKDGNGQYLWQPSVQLGVPAKINGRDYKVSAYAPNTFTSGQYTAIFGDFKWYWIQDSLHMLISVLNELYAATRQTGYVIDSETDGMPVLEAAFARLKMA